MSNKPVPCEVFGSVNRWNTPHIQPAARCVSRLPVRRRQGQHCSLHWPSLSLCVMVAIGPQPSVNNIALVRLERVSLEDNLVIQPQRPEETSVYPRPWQRSNRSTWPRLCESLSRRLFLPQTGFPALISYGLKYKCQIIYCAHLWRVYRLCVFFKGKIHSRGLGYRLQWGRGAVCFACCLPKHRLSKFL